MTIVSRPRARLTVEYSAALASFSDRDSLYTDRWSPSDWSLIWQTLRRWIRGSGDELIFELK